MFIHCVYLVSALAVMVGADLCSQANCTCTTLNRITEMNCQSLGLTQMIAFENITHSVNSIDLSKNNIKSVPVLSEIDALKILKLDHNEIAEVVPGAFKNFNYLEQLDLCHNNIRELKDLDGLSGLRSLNLSHNYLRSLPNDIFFKIDQLVELRLEGNPLHYLQHQWFRTLTKVTFLDVSECALSSLPGGVFHDMLSLVELDLSKNNFEEVPTAELRSAQKLTKLKMNGNELVSIEAHSFKKCKLLEELELSDMGTLQRIRPAAFSGLKVLKKLRISHNPNLEELDFGAFEGLYDSLEEKWGIEELVLRENGLQGIRSPSTVLCRIHTLDLQGNPWKCDCNLAWISACEIREELTGGLKCSSPHDLEDKLIRQTGAEEMVCPPDMMAEQHQKVLRIVVVTSGLVGIVFCAIIIVVVVKKRKIMEWWYYRKRGSGAVYYVKAKTNQDGTGDI